MLTILHLQKCPLYIDSDVDSDVGGGRKAETHLIGWRGAATKLTADCDNTRQSETDGHGLPPRTCPDPVCIWSDLDII
jgi:hypothetical protein